MAKRCCYHCHGSPDAEDANESLMDVARGRCPRRSRITLRLRSDGLPSGYPPAVCQLLAHRVDSLRCEGSDAIGAKRTCRQRRERVDLTKMTHQRHRLCTAATVLMDVSAPIKVLV